MPTGQPFDDLARERFLMLVSEGSSIPTAAAQLGFKPKTVKTHLQNDAEFRSALEEAEDLALGAVEDVVYREAVDHKAAWAVKMWLTNRGPRGRWVDERDRHAGASGAALAAPELIVGAMREMLSDGTTRDAAIVAIRSVPLPAIETTAVEV